MNFKDTPKVSADFRTLGGFWLEKSRLLADSRRPAMRAVRPREAQQRQEWRILSFEVSDSWDTLREYEKTSLCHRCFAGYIPSYTYHIIMVKSY